jgi:hypothetical protein
VGLVINTEAEAVPSAIFKAVHSPSALKVSGPIGTQFQDLRPEHFTSRDQDTLLQEFLYPDAAYRRMVVFGRPGCGKSHLIHWLKLQIPSTPKRLVIVVPKAGTSLRAILESLISELRPDQQTPFREALNRTGEATATRKGQKERLLNEIAYALGEAAPSEDGSDQDLERELLKVLPYLFQDIHFREKHFYQEGNVIAELVDHVFAAPSTYRPAEQRRAFTLDDLPVDPLDFKDAAQQAQNALRYLYTLPEAAKLAVRLVNRCLDVAIGRTLSFTGDRLVGLMAELRNHLFQQERELVLLIEDFARVQGLDRYLLQAMIEQGDDKKKLCKLRWAIGVTTGFFEQVVETVYMRVTHFVDMDRSAGRREGARLDATALAEFAGPYLNAVRLGAEDLQNWEARPGEPLPDACRDCPEKPVCHATFGATERGHGLYPFTERALWNMARRADDHLEDTFNPRTLQTGVLVPVLDGAAPSLGAGQFPPATLLEGLGGYRSFDAAARRLLRSLAGDEEGRMGALLELWDGSGHLVNLSSSLLEAFSAPRLAETDDAVVVPEEAVEPMPSGGKATPSDQRTREEKELEAWARGDPLDKAPDRLRPLVFEAVADSIDWDDLGLERSSFCGAEDARPFRRRSVTFTRQGTKVLPSLVMLEIPGSAASREEFDRTAIALSGLLRAEREGHWDFPGGSTALALYLECLAGWRGQVIAQLRALTGVVDGWDHAAGAAELLAIGCAINGRLKADADQVADVATLFAAEWPSDVAPGSPEMKRLYEALSGKSQERLREQLRALSSGSKGGEVGTLIDPALPLVALKRLRSNAWRLQQTPPEDLAFDSFKRTADLYRRVAAALESAASAEAAARLQWLSDMEDAFGAEAKRAKILQDFEAVRTEFSHAGLAGASARKLDDALSQLSGVQFDDALAAARGLRDSADPVAHLPAYARSRPAAVTAGRLVAESAREFLAQCRGRLEEEANRDAANAQAVEADIQAIEDALRTIATTLPPEEAPDAA